MGSEVFVLSLDAFVRSVGVKTHVPNAFFLGAGASVTSGIPSAETCIWEWKQRIFLTSNPGLEPQFSELSLSAVKDRIQSWLDRQGIYPERGAAEEYGFYIQECFPIKGDRRAYFESKVRSAKPHIGYRLICHLAQAGLVRSTWSTNFDGLVARAAAGFDLIPIEIGVDCQNRFPHSRREGELLCVSMHGDYRYDDLKNTPEELQNQERLISDALAKEATDTPLIVAGYSGRDTSIMSALMEAYSTRSSAPLYWCGYRDDDIPDGVRQLLTAVRKSGRDAYFVPSQGFDDLLTRLSFHCLMGASLIKAKEDISTIVEQGLLSRTPFFVERGRTTTVIKSNAFEVECPAEVLQFGLKQWPEQGKVWAWLREQTRDKDVVVAPLRGRILAIGSSSSLREAFGPDIDGAVQHVPVAPEELAYDDGAIVGLMRAALVRAIAASLNVPTDKSENLWFREPRETFQDGELTYCVHDSVYVSLRRVGSAQYAVLLPSLRVLCDGEEAPREVSDAVKRRILGYQHNKPFNQVLNRWRALLFPDRRNRTFTFPPQQSDFAFTVSSFPIFAEISVPYGPTVTLPANVKRMVRHDGVRIEEPRLAFATRAATSLANDIHPIRGLVNNRPFDFPLTIRGLASSVRIGVICPQREAALLASYLADAHRPHKALENERDYLLDYPGFQQAYGLPIEVPRPGDIGWITYTEPTQTDPRRAAIEVANMANSSIQGLQASFAPHVILILYPKRWISFRGFRNATERFDVHDFVKAFAVQRGVATQFLDEETLSDRQRCRVWWWLSLALYAKSMRTPWVLDSLSEDTAFVGLGFSIDRNAPSGSQVVLGCSHIYSARGEGLQYRLSKVENPVIRGRNPFMSKDDARRVGETIRELFFEARSKLPRRVVLHKRTPFRRDEREGLKDGLSGIEHIDMLEIQEDAALRYVASRIDRGEFGEDNYPVRRGTAVRLDEFTALLWVHGATDALVSGRTYYQGKRRIPTPLTIRRHAGSTDMKQVCGEVLALSKMNWNSFDFYARHPATLQSSNEIARIGSLLQRFGTASYDYRLFI